MQTAALTNAEPSGPTGSGLSLLLLPGSPAGRSSDPGLGSPAATKRHDHPAIRESVTRLLSEDAFRSRALALRDEIAEMAAV